MQKLVSVLVQMSCTNVSTLKSRTRLYETKPLLGSFERVGLPKRRLMRPLGKIAKLARVFFLLLGIERTRVRRAINIAPQLAGQALNVSDTNGILLPLLLSWF